MKFPLEGEAVSEVIGQPWRPRVPERITGFSHDTRRLQPGECFLAFRTDVADGHAYLEDAERKEASGAIVERGTRGGDFPRMVVPSVLNALEDLAVACRRHLTLPVYAITGSYGKTSTKELLALLFGKDSTHASPGNWNNRIGLPLSVFQTPSDKVTQVILEAGINEPGEMRSLGRIANANATILTGIGPVHLEKLISLEGVATEKAELARMSKPDAPFYFPVEAFVYEAVRTVTRPRRILVPEGTDAPDSLEPTDAVYFYQTNKLDSISSLHTRLLIRKAGGGEDSWSFVLPPMSAGMRRNAALAILVALEAGIAETELAERLSQWEAPEKRGEILRDEDRMYWVDCYNANPDSVRDSASAFLERFPHEPKLWIIGAMEELGENADWWHEETGKNLPVKSGDTIAYFGDFGVSFYQGIEASGKEFNACLLNPGEHEFGELLNEFAGAVFLKGSRKQRLEKWIPEEVVPCL